VAISVVPALRHVVSLLGPVPAHVDGGSALLNPALVAARLRLSLHGAVAAALLPTPRLLLLAHLAALPLPLRTGITAASARAGSRLVRLFAAPAAPGAAFTPLGISGRKPAKDCRGHQSSQHHFLQHAICLHCLWGKKPRMLLLYLYS